MSKFEFQDLDAVELLALFEVVQTECAKRKDELLKQLVGQDNEYLYQRLRAHLNGQKPIALTPGEANLARRARRFYH